MWFFHVWICHIWIIHVWILPMWRDGETPDLRSKRHFPTREYWNMESPSKAPYSERNCRKSTFILTVNCLIHPPIRGKENRPPHKPINSAIGTGDLDFLIAYALLILCHSLFEAVVGIVHNDGEIPSHRTYPQGMICPCGGMDIAFNLSQHI